MLELLSQGASAKAMARKLGYSEGTMRVYLHNLYRKIGVRNKTEAVIWHMNRARAHTPSAPVAPQTTAAREATLPAGPSVGDMALAEDLYTALGAMGSFLGPYGHVWEAAVRLKGGQADEKALARRMQSRLLWRALLKGDFAYGKALYDEGIGECLLVDSPSDAVLLGALLLLGGYSSCASRLAAQLTDKRKGTPRITAREAALLRSLREAIEGAAEAGVATLHEVAAEGARAPLVRQAAMASLFHVYRMRRDLERAGSAAAAMWSEAEAARRQLEAMGVRPLPREAALPRPSRESAVREKVAVAR